MNDYQLERLNTRSFEQLVQALALAVLGHQVSVFGDGPDGGREAAFRGGVNFPQGGRNWNGYGIVQAKFRQHPADLARKNADWSLGELKAEFKKLKPKPRRATNRAAEQQARTCPDYYVFATNLALSPVLKSGGKDRVADFLEACKHSHGLLDYAIWDGDQIRRMLDSQTAIRTSFLPFILPGDVLALVMQNLQPKRADFAKIMLRYLQLELLDDQFAKLSQGGYTNASRISLSNVFVDLPIEGDAGRDKMARADSASPQRATFLQGLFADAGCVLRPSYRPAQMSGTTADVRGAVAGRCVIIGGPGQGKTTVGLFACQMLRAALLQEAGGPYDRDVEQALVDIASQAGTLPPLTTLRYPMRVDLKRLAEALATGYAGGPVNTLMDFLTQHIAKRTGARLDTEDFRLWLRSFPWLLVLDGLDEVPASSNRTLMMNAINDFIRVEAHQEDADLMVVATTRPQGYSDEFDPTNYAHLSLLPLLPEEALHYGTRLAEARHPGAASRVEDLGRTLTLATRNPATARLMESPLQVTIMLSLIELGGHPPEQRWQLFNQYYDTIFKREKERGTQFSATLRDYEADIHWIHHRAGWLLQQRNAESGKTAARLSHDEFDALVHQRLVGRGHVDDDALAALVKQMREAATDRLVLLVGNTAHEIGFEIRSLQEFMAAEHSFDGDDESVRATLKLIAPHSYWRNVFLFMAGRIFFNKEPLVDSLVAICDYLNEPLNDAAQAQIEAGSRLALALLADDACRKQPANTRRLARLAARLMDKPLWDDRTPLSLQFKREAGAVLKQELTNRLEATRFAPSAWTVCLELARNDFDGARELVVRRFPWRHGELNRFLSYHIELDADLGEFLWGEIARHFRHVSWGVVRLLRRRGQLREQRRGQPREQRLGQLREHIDPDVAGAMERLDEGSEVKLLATDGTVLHNRISGVNFDLTRYLSLRMQGQDFSDAHPDWKQLAAAVEFAAEPTLENLCRQLPTVLAAELLPTANYGLPWQFNVCIDAVRSGVAIDTVLVAVARASIGTPTDWNRWAKTLALPIPDLSQPVDYLSVSDHNLGGVFSLGGWHHRSAGIKEEIQFLSELQTALPALRAGREVSAALIQVACFGLNRVASELDESSVARIRAFITAARQHGHGVGREMVSAILLSKVSVSGQVELLALLNAKAPSAYWLSDFNERRHDTETAWLNVYDSALATGREQDVLPALSQLSPLACMGKVGPDVLQRAMQGDLAQRHAATLIKLSAQCWSANEANAVARQVLDLTASEEHWLREWMDYIDSTGLHGDHLEALLLELQVLANAGQRDMFEFQWARLLAKIVDRRPAPIALPDPSPPRPETQAVRH